MQWFNGLQTFLLICRFKFESRKFASCYEDKKHMSTEK